MRTLRVLTVALTIIGCLPITAGAQQTRQFRDSWYWGAKGGGFMFADSAANYTIVPAVGGEWLITRTNGGLYIALSQAFLTDRAFIPASSNPADPSEREVTLQNLRRLEIALMGFPRPEGRLRPYIGIGFTMHQIGSATPQGPFATPQQQAFANDVVAEAKVAFSPVAIGGAQVNFRLISVFAQATASAANSNFFLGDRQPVFVGYEAGLRYNIGSAIARE